MLLAPGSRLPAPGSRLLAPGSWLLAFAMGMKLETCQLDPLVRQQRDVLEADLHLLHFKIEFRSAPKLALATSRFCAYQPFRSSENPCAQRCFAVP